MRPKILLLALCTLPLLPAAPARAEDAKKLTVLIKTAKPFVFEKNGAPAGYSIDLWQRVAGESGVQFDFQPAASAEEVVAALRDKKADVGVGALSITAEREAVIDFSHPYYHSGLQIMVNAAGQRSPFRAFLKLNVFGILALLIVAVAVNAHLLWFFERKKNPESFPAEYPAGILNAAWWSISTIITLGCENIAPTRVPGRLLGIVWMLAGVALYSYVTATVTSSMTVDTLQSDIHSVSDLEGMEVGTVTGSSSARFLQENHVPFQAFADMDAACLALAHGDLKAVVYDAPLLKYYLTMNTGSRLRMAGELLEKQDYGFALPDQSPLRKEINRVLLKLTEEGFLDELDKKWFAPVEH